MHNESDFFITGALSINKSSYEDVLRAREWQDFISQNFDFKHSDFHCKYTMKGHAMRELIIISSYSQFEKLKSQLEINDKRRLVIVTESQPNETIGMIKFLKEKEILHFDLGYSSKETLINVIQTFLLKDNPLPNFK